MQFDWSLLSTADLETATRYLGGTLREPDLVIAPDGNPYLYRWWLVRSEGEQFGGNVYFHIQVNDDPERPLHDHPWHNQSVILSGGYVEVIQPEPPNGPIRHYLRHKGEVIHRCAREAHRLLMPPSQDYTMSQFSTGPKVKDWGFWYPDGWRHWRKVTAFTDDGRSVHLPIADAHRRQP